MAYPKGKKNPQSGGHIKSKQRNVEILNMSCAVPSQVVNDLYVKLAEENMLPKFKAVLQCCSSEGLDLEASIGVLKGALPYYIGDYVTKDLLVDLIKNHGEIADAWGYGVSGEKYREVMLNNKIFDILMSSRSLEQFLMYKEYLKDDTVDDVSDNKPIFNFNLTRG